MATGKVWLYEVWVWLMRDVVTAALTHDSDLVQRPVPLPRLRPRNKVPQPDGAQRDETEVDPIQERPGVLHRAEHGRRRHEERQQHQNQQQQEVDDGGRPRLDARTLYEADRSEDQGVHEPLDAGGEHQHGEGDSDQGVEDGEAFSSVRQRSGVTITWRLRKVTDQLETAEEEEAQQKRPHILGEKLKRSRQKHDVDIHHASSFQLPISRLFQVQISF